MTWMSLMPSSHVPTSVRGSLSRRLLSTCLQGSGGVDLLSQRSWHLGHTSHSRVSSHMAAMMGCFLRPRAGRMRRRVSVRDCACLRLACARVSAGCFLRRWWRERVLSGRGKGSDGLIVDLGRVRGSRRPPPPADIDARPPGSAQPASWIAAMSMSSARCLLCSRPVLRSSTVYVPAERHAGAHRLALRSCYRTINTPGVYMHNAYCSLVPCCAARLCTCRRSVIRARAALL